MKKQALIILLSLLGWSSQAKSVFLHTADSLVVHVVLFEFNENVQTAQIDQLMQNIAQLSGTIPGIIELSWGKNFSQRSKGFTYAVTIKFTGKNALDNFYSHPLHQKLVKESIKPMTKNMIVTDYIDTSESTIKN